MPRGIDAVLISFKMNSQDRSHVIVFDGFVRDIDILMSSRTSVPDGDMSKFFCAILRITLETLHLAEVDLRYGIERLQGRASMP